MSDDRNLLLEEWKEIRATLRYAGTKRFAQLTVFVAISGFMFDALARHDGIAARLFLALSGILLAILFAFMEWRAAAYWRGYLDRGKAIEEALGVIELMSSHRPSAAGWRRWLTSTNATYCLFVLAALTWLGVGAWSLAEATLAMGR